MEAGSVVNDDLNGFGIALDDLLQMTSRATLAYFRCVKENAFRNSADFQGSIDPHPLVTELGWHHGLVTAKAPAVTHRGVKPQANFILDPEADPLVGFKIELVKASKQLLLESRFGSRALLDVGLARPDQPRSDFFSQ